MAYNASVLESFEGCGGHGFFVAEVDMLNGRPQMLRSNYVHTYRYEGLTFATDNTEGKWKAGDAIYDYYIRATHPQSEFEIRIDGCAAYRAKLGRLDLPPAYRV